MKFSRVAPALVALCIVAPGFAHQPQDATQIRHKPVLKNVPCWFKVPEHRRASCFWFYPGDQALGQPVRLPAVHIFGDNTGTGPLLYIPGGPGYSAGLDATGMRRWWRWRDVTRWPQDLWLFDPRGTGLSQPAIDCSEIRASDRSSLGKALSTQDEYKNLQTSARACYQRLGGGQQLKAFNSAKEVADITGLLQASGQTNWNIWAVSYGTRIAMQLLRDPPQGLRSVILDSAFPPEISGFLAKPAQLQRGLDVIVSSCRQRTNCAAKYSHLQQKIDALLRQLGQAPTNIELFYGPKLVPVTLAVTDFRLIWMLFFDSYLTHSASDTAAAIDAAAHGEIGALKPLAHRYVNALLDPSFSAAVYYTQTCAEDAPGVERAAFAKALERTPKLAKYLRFEWPYAVCRFWRAGSVPADYHQAVKIDLPVLFVSGENDPATLPKWARAAAARMPNSQILLLPGASHAPTFSNSCAMQSVAQFLQLPTKRRTFACAVSRPRD